MSADSFLANQNNPSQRNRDGFLEISVSDDKMTAYADIYPPINEGNPVTPDIAANYLASELIVYGVVWENLNEAIFECNTNRKIITELEVAKGEVPVKEIPEYIHLDSHLFAAGLEEKIDDLQVDYREFSAYTTVQEGELLGQTVPKRPGKTGKNVFGEELPYGKKDRKQLTLGENVVLQDDKAIAAKAGRFVRDETSFWVETALEVKGNIDYHTGHIDFPGNVSISGDVKGGFRIRTTGDFSCKGTIEATGIEVHGSLLAMQGIIGKEKSLIRVAGDVKAKFLQRTTVECNSNVLVKDSIYHSKVSTLGNFAMGKAGKVVHSYVKARGSVKAARFGNLGAAPCRIVLGVDFVVEKKIELLKSKQKNLGIRILLLQKLMERQNSAKNERIQKSLVDKVNEIATILPNLKEKVFCNPSAELLCLGTVFPGVEVQFGEHLETVLEKQDKVRYYYDAMLKKIMHEKIASRND